MFEMVEEGSHPARPAAELLRAEDGDELRTVTLEWDEGGEVALTERCGGPLTEVMFGTATHARRVVVGESAIRSAVHGYGIPQDDLVEALTLFFRGPAAFLSDLQDVLDRTGVEYACAVWSDDDVAYRAPAA